MTRYPSPLIRLWRSGPWIGNPLMRASDRVEAVIRILAVLVVLAAVPVAAAIGTAHYTDAAAQIRAADAGKTRVTATVAAEPIRTTTAAMEMSAQRTEALVRWEHDGRTSTATTAVADTARRGDPATVWLGPDGNPTDPPLPSDAAAIRGIGSGLAAFAQICGAAVAVVGVTAWSFGARRRAALAREWRMISRPIGTQ
ncbi:hypothetical protein NONO_c48940 [Nocardia nova SH22a]|uniref:Transmembrane protein n=1 Tax=Nocardia nova SH22a TaxID=1415166 RepID=W5TL27_9NOCA|nr:hypothetical protein [Nocardia nova]AHH19678.1 hypothetical protein NONO_c48940 [Nocardia nova SH22a]